MTRITVACLDMAGTTIADDGTVLEAFSSAISEQNLPAAMYDQAMTDVRSSMGQSKIEVFRRILGDEETAQKANDAFENHYAAAVRGGAVAAVPGAEETITALRQAGVRVCLATGFSPATRDAIIDKLVWGGLIDLALSPADAGFWGFEGRGRPWPDLPLIALLKLRGGAVSELAVVGDTTSDIESGLRAGAAIVAGVLTGASSRADLEKAGAPLILDSIADILPHVTGLPADIVPTIGVWPLSMVAALAATGTKRKWPWPSWSRRSCYCSAGRGTASDGKQQAADNRGAMACLARKISLPKLQFSGTGPTCRILARQVR